MKWVCECAGWYTAQQGQIWLQCSLWEPNLWRWSVWRQRHMPGPHPVKRGEEYYLKDAKAAAEAAAKDLGNPTEEV